MASSLVSDSVGFLARLDVDELVLLKLFTLLSTSFMLLATSFLTLRGGVTLATPLIPVVVDVVSFLTDVGVFVDLVSAVFRRRISPLSVRDGTWCESMRDLTSEDLIRVSLVFSTSLSSFTFLATAVAVTSFSTAVLAFEDAERLPVVDAVTVATVLRSLMGLLTAAVVWTTLAAAAAVAAAAAAAADFAVKTGAFMNSKWRIFSRPSRIFCCGALPGNRIRVTDSDGSAGCHTSNAQTETTSSSGIWNSDPPILTVRLAAPISCDAPAFHKRRNSLTSLLWMLGLMTYMSSVPCPT